MANLTGKYGSVQRVLRRRRTTAGDLSVWEGMSVSSDGLTYTYVPPTTTSASSPLRWGIRARPTPDGYQPNNLTSPTDPSAPSDYSNTVSAVQNWSLENNTETQSYVASNTNSYNAKYAGKRSCTGKFAGIGAFPPLNPGDRFLFRGFIGPENGSYRNVGGDFNLRGYVYQIAAVVTSISVNINYGTFAPIQWSVNWQSDWQAPADELLCFGIPSDLHGFYDETDPPCGEDIPSTTCTMRMGKTRKTALGGSPIQVCIESANLTFNTGVTPVTNSCSARSGGWQTSVVGSTDVQLQTQVHGSHYDVFNKVREADADDLRLRSQYHYPGVDRYVRIYVGSNDYCVRNGAWEFNKMFVGSYTGLNVDIEKGGLVSFGTTMEFNAFPKANLTAEAAEDVAANDLDACDRGYIRYRLPDPERSITGIPATDKTQDTADSTPANGWVSFLDLQNRALNPSA